MATISFLCKVTGDTDWHPVSSPSYETAEQALNWLEGFMGVSDPTMVKDRKSTRLNSSH